MCRDRDRRVKICEGESMTQQSFKKECDINEIMRRFRKSGDPHYLQRLGKYTEGSYGDFSQVMDYRSALDAVARAAEVFDALPAKVRREFDNDPARFLDFCEDPRNGEQLIAMGLATRRVEQVPEKTTPQADA